MSSTLKDSQIGTVNVGKGPGSTSTNLVMGFGALGYAGTNASENTAIGYSALAAISNSVLYKCNTVIGGRAASQCNGHNASVTIGFNANRQSKNKGGVTIGYAASRYANNYCSVVIGNFAGWCSYNTCSVVIGNFASRCNGANRSVIIGYKAGCKNVGDAWDQSVIIGTSAAIDNAYPDPRSIISIGKCTQSHGKFNVTIGDYARGGLRSVVLGHGASGMYYDQVVVGYSATNGAGNYSSTWGNSGNNTKNCIWPSWSFLSDCRDKADITPLSENYGVPLLKKLKPASFKWDNRETYVREKGMDFGQKDGSFVSEETQYGFIAQDVKAAADELNIKIPGVENESEKYRLPYETFIFTSVSAIKDIINRVETLEEELTLLENS